MKQNTTLDYNALSDKYKPESIKLLLIGETPPKGGTRFFYLEDVDDHDYVFLAVMEAIDQELKNDYLKYNHPPVMKISTLEHFKKLGGFLTDLCLIPKDLIPVGESPLHYSQDFIERLKKLPLSDDCKIIIFKGGDYLKEILLYNGFQCENIPLSRNNGGSRGNLITAIRKYLNI